MVSIPQGTINTRPLFSLVHSLTRFPFRKVQLIQRQGRGTHEAIWFPFRKVQLIRSLLVLRPVEPYMFPFRKVQLILIKGTAKQREIAAVSIPQGTINTPHCLPGSRPRCLFPFRKVQLIRRERQGRHTSNTFPFRKVQLIRKNAFPSASKKMGFHSARYN